MTTSSDATKNQRSKKLATKIILAIAPRLVALYLRIVFFTNRESTKGLNRLQELLDQEEPVLVAIWHESTAVLLPKFGQKHFHALSSKSTDGELATRLLKCFRVECIRGSSSRDGSQALNEMVKTAPNVKALGITIDGPRGPRRKSKPGIVVLSQRTGYSILLVAASATKSIRIKSWDRTCIPLPFGRFVYSIGDLIPPPESNDRECISAKILEVEKALADLQASLEAQFDIDPLLPKESQED